MSNNNAFAIVNEAKADLQHIYNQPDPRAYFCELRKLNYEIPDSAKPLFQRLIIQLQQRQKKSICVLDLGCSYGVNAAMLKHGMTMPELYAHWTPSRFAEAHPDEVLEYGRRFFGERPGSNGIEIIGLDQAENAVTFAKDAGLIDQGIVADLEVQALPTTVKKQMASVDLVTSTGCVGYITERTFERLMPAVTRGQAPWIANFVLRLFPYDKIATTLADWGYLTERLEGRTFVQRRFSSEQEQQQILQLLTDMGIDPAGREAEGYLHAEFYLSRPEKDARQLSLVDLIAV